MNKTVVISGANGFIGRYLIDFFLAKKYHVVALIHRAKKQAVPGVEYRLFDLDSFSTDIIPNNADAFIHAAYIPYKKGNNSSNRNYKATSRLFKIAQDKQLKNFIYLSSFSAMPNALSEYGKSKYEIEKIFSEKNALILRPGLVIGYGGLYKNIKSIIAKTSLIPLIGKGKQLVQRIDVEEVAEFIYAGIEGNIHGDFNIGEKEPISMKAFYLDVAQRMDRKITFIPIPYYIAGILIRIMEVVFKNPPLRKENLLGLKQMSPRKTISLEAFKSINEYQEPRLNH